MGIPPAATRESIASLRENELKEACRHLHITQLHLLGFRDKTLEIQPMDHLVKRVLLLLRAEQPASVLTFHERLGGHPDHCTIGKAATLAFAEYKKDNPFARLFFVAWPAFAKDPEKHGLLGEQLMQVDISEKRVQKLKAFRAHKTQSDMNDWVWGDDQAAIAAMDPVEWFIQAEPPFDPNQNSLV